MPDRSSITVATEGQERSGAKSGSSPSVAWLVVGVGMVCALHVGKLPAAIPVLQDEIGVTLVQAGFLLSTVQMAGMLAGAFVGVLADRLGPRRVMLAGLILLSLGSLAGAGAPGVQGLLLARVFEGMGFLLSVLPAPGLIRRAEHDPAVLSKALGLWGAYMPTGTALALLLAPSAYRLMGWRWSWVALSLLTVWTLVLVWRRVPVDPPLGRHLGATSLSRRMRLTLSSQGPWAVALAFFMYSGQWLAVIGFLPSVYAAAGWSVWWVGVLTALAAGVNIVGNVSAGHLLARGVRPVHVLVTAYSVMAVSAWVVFASPWGVPVRYLAVLVFSGVGGMIPGALFGLAVRLAPSQDTVSTTVGWMQQLSSLGQFVGPPLVAGLAVRVGGWEWTWCFTGSCSLAGIVIGWRLQRLLPSCSERER